MELAKIKDNQWNAVRKIYTEAFPKKEQKPFTSLKSSVKKGKTELLTASENDTLLGFTALIPYKDMVMVDYLAVNSAIRSKGTGSRILQNVCNLYSNKKIVLLIEQIDKMAENNQQRIARRKFYLRNGFASSDIYISGVSVSYYDMRRHLCDPHPGDFHRRQHIRCHLGLHGIHGPLMLYTL